MANFDSARVKHMSKARELEGMLKFYSYSSKADAAKTDERLKELLVGRLRDGKQTIFDIVQFIYQIQEDKALDSIFEPLRDEVDVLCDEVKVSHFDWNEMPEKWWEMVISHDLTLADSATNLSELADEMRSEITTYKKAGDIKVFDEKKMKQSARNMESLLDGIRRAFKEREAILSLEESDFDQDFETIRKKIEASI